MAELPGLTGKFDGPVVLVADRRSFAESQKGEKLFYLLEEKDTIVYHATVAEVPSSAMIDDAVHSWRQQTV
jgi:hypothetical protein